MAFSYEPNQPKLDKELADRITQIRSLVNLVVSSKTLGDFQNIPAQLDLSEEIKMTINHVLSDGEIYSAQISDIQIK